MKKLFNFKENQSTFEELQAKAAAAFEGVGIKTINPFEEIVNFLEGRDGEFYLGYNDVRGMLECVQCEDDVFDYLREFFDWEISEKFEEIFNDKHKAFEVLKMTDGEREDAYLEGIEEAEQYVFDSYEDSELKAYFHPFTFKGQEALNLILTDEEFEERYSMLLMVDKIHYERSEVRKNILELLQGSTFWDNYESLMNVLSTPEEYFKPACEFLGI